MTNSGGSEDEAKAFVTELYKRTPVLDTGARAATATFSQKGIGDVHLTFESEAHLEVDEAGGDLETLSSATGPPSAANEAPPARETSRAANERRESVNIDVSRRVEFRTGET